MLLGRSNTVASRGKYMAALVGDKVADLIMKLLALFPASVQRIIIMLAAAGIVFWNAAKITDKIEYDHKDTINRFGWVLKAGANRDKRLDKIDDVLLIMSRNQAAMVQYQGDTSERLKRDETILDRPK